MLKKLARYFRFFLTLISPVLNTKLVYFVKFKRFLDLNNPVTLNEKILWLKLNTYLNNPLVKQCADKFRVRDYIINCGYEECLIETLGIYKEPRDIKWKDLPQKFVIKLNVGCHYNYIVFDKNEENEQNVKKTIVNWVKTSAKYYLGHAEMQYKDVEPVVIIEKFIDNGKDILPEDYKFYCINGKVKLIMLCLGRDMYGHGANFIFVDSNWNYIASSRPVDFDVLQKPVLFEKAIDIAENLAAPFPFVRTDLYLLDNKVYFGELTFTPAAGMDVDHLLKIKGTDEDIDHMYGAMLKI